MSGTWTKAQSPYILNGSVTVPTGQTLVIQPGVVIEVPNFSYNFTINGTLLAQGTAADSIYIRGKANPQAGSQSTHGGVLFFNAGSSASILENVSIDRMGDTYFYGKAVSIATGEQPTIRNTSITNSERYDVEAWAGGAKNFTRLKAVVALDNSTVDSTASLPNLGYAGSFYQLLGSLTVPKDYKLTIAPGVVIEVPNFGTNLFINGTLLAQGTAADSIYIRGKANPQAGSQSTHGGVLFFNAGSSASILENVSIDRMGDTYFYGKAVSIATGEQPTIRNTSITNSERYDVEAWAGGAKNFTRLKAVVALDNSTVDSTASLPNLGYAGSFYQLLGSLTVPKDYKLTIAPGVVIEVPNFGTNLFINGTLLAQGTAADSIYIRGKANPQAGSQSTHGGVLFFNAGSSASILENVSIDRMGDTYFYGRAVDINTDGVRILKSTISNSEAIGIRSNANSLTVTASTVFGNLTGIYNSTGTPTLQSNKIYRNTDYGINNGGSQTIDARNTYWGAPTGPFHPTLNPNGKGNKVSDRVLFSPWIEQIIQVDQTISFAEIPNKYVDDTLVLTATATSALPVSFSITTQPATGVAVLTGNTITFPGAVGQVTVTAYQSGNESFKPAQLQRTFTVSKRNQSITFNSISTKTVGDAPFSLTATATSGLPVSFSVVSGPATLDGNTLTLTAAGTVVVEARQPGDRLYNSASSVQQSFGVVIPALSITNLPASATEGQTVTFKVTTSFAPSSLLTVFLQSSNQARFPVPASVTIAAGALSVDVSVNLEQDNIPEIDLAVVITAGASNHSPTTSTILVKDNDLPNLELLILSNNISESAGANATQAILRRTSSSNSIAFTANLSASLPNTLLLPSSISLAQGENEKTFTIGAVDNSLVDGPRLVTVTASLFVSSCNCNAPPTSSGSVSATVVVNDDDGPSLTLTVNQQTLLEGLANAGTLRITRSGAITNALSVTLTSSTITEATLPATVVIPAGQTFVDVPITTLDDGTTDGNQTVYFTATALGLSPGSVFVVVTDLNKPDLQIPLVQLTSNKVQAGDDVNYQVSIKNSGGTTAPSGIVVQGYLSTDNVIDASDILLSVDTLSEAIPAGQTKILAKSVKAPATPGSYKLLFWANPNATLGELLLTNNVSTPVSLTIESSYTATAAVGPTYFLQGNTIPITGSATRTNGSPAANVPVEVYVITQGIRRTVSDTTDASGNFSVPFVPLSREAGHYIVGASFPGLIQTTEQDGFDILGVRVNKGDNILLTATQNETLSGSVSVENLSGKSLSNFTLTPVTLPGGATIQFAVLPNLAGNTSANLGYTVNGSALTSGNNYVDAIFQAKSDEGIIQKVNAYYYCQAANAYITADVSHIQANVSQSSGERRIEVKLVNIGKAATGSITINLPNANWLTSVTPKTLLSLAPGDTAVAVLNFIALGEIPVNSPIDGSIGINSVNGNSFSIPFTFQKVSEASGTARIIATDQFTYNTNNGNGPKVKDALVKITNFFTGEVYAQGNTTEEGIFVGASIPEGKHRITVEKDKHLPYEGILEINPGATTESTIFLNYQAITFSWNVMPTTVQDQYETVLEATFETNVPMPVVTIEMPKTMPQLSAGQEYQFMITLTNHGLITAEEVTLNLPTDSEYEFVTNYIPGDLLAKQSIQVPVVMRRRSGLAGGRSITESTNDPCANFVGVVYGYKCNSVGLWERTGASFTIPGRVCPLSNFGHLLGGGGTAIAGLVRQIVPFKIEKKSCVACISDIAEAIVGCIPGGSVAKLVYDYTQLLICYGGELIDASIDHDLDAFGKGLYKCAITSAVELNGGLAIKLIPEKIIKEIPIVKQIFCMYEIYKAIQTCAGSVISSARTSAGGRIKANELPNAALREIASNLQVVMDGYNAQRNWMAECFGDLIDRESWPILFTLLVNPYFDKQIPIPASIQSDVIKLMAGYDIQSSELSAFFTRWNTSLEAKANNVLAPNANYPNIINWNQVKIYVAALTQAHNYSVKKGFKTIDEMFSESIKSLNAIIDGQKNGVCASVTVQFSQQLTMTREAFEGNLEIFNGHPTDAMKTVSVNIQITDENGTPSNGLFEIQPQNPASVADINAQQKGSVKFLFIPQVDAAPQTSKVYNFGGSVTYWDPFTQTTITLPLAAVSITVNPSPNLTLHYFMQRNILGDDALTTPIEPSVPAELAVMVENHGYGPARDVTISSAQPKIVDNEKGLAIDFNLIGSTLQGKPVQLGLTNIDLGTIEPLKTKIGQWYFTSSLLGKFVSYDAKVVHNSSFGNKDLSLVQGVKLHELTKSIRLYGDLEDGITDFLVNDVFDVNDVPDIIYFSQGNQTAKVSPATSGSFNTPVSGPTFTNTLTVTPSEAGFNYIKLPDPGNRLYELVSVTRSDGQVIPLDNAWLTFVTLPVLRSPIYENKFHIVDNFASTASATYTVVWKPKDIDVPKIDSIAGVPTQVTSTQVKNLKVYFNKRIDPATFTYEDLTLSLQGGPNSINSSVIITQLDSISFNVDLSAVTTGNGLYEFTVQTATIQDIHGVSGNSGKQVSWSQFLNEVSFAGLQSTYCSNATSQTLVGVPAGGTFSGPGITGNVFDPIVAGVGSHTITYSKDGKSFYLTTLVNPVPNVLISPASTTLTCAKPTASLTAISSTSGVNYSWNGPASFTATVITPTINTAGVYSVTAIASGGCSAIASTTVLSDASLLSSTLVNSGPFSCSTTSVTLTASGGDTYKFSTGATQTGTGNTATVNSAGVYSVTVIAANGCTAITSTTVTSDASVPTATLASSGTLSCTTNSVTLTATGGGTYTFSEGTTQAGNGPTATVTATGVYSVTAILANGCTATTSTTVTGDASVPTATLVNSGPISCSVNSVTLTARGGAVYKFSAGATQVNSSSIATVNTAGIYSVTVIAANGCSAGASTTVTGDTNTPTVSLVSSGPLSCSASSVTLTANGGSNYIFSAGAIQIGNTNTATVSTAGIYSVTVSTAGGCSAVASTTVIGDATVPAITLINNGPLSCSAMSVTLTAGGTGAGTSYMFSAGATQIGSGPIATVTTAGVYSVTALTSNGCLAVASSTVTGDATLPVVTLTNSSPLSCYTSSVTLTAGGTGMGTSYTFSTGATQVGNTNTAVVSVAGVYSVTVLTTSGCSAVASTTVVGDTSTPYISLVSSGTLSCSTSSVTLTASGGGSGASYIFSAGAIQVGGTNIATVSTAGVYSVTVLANGGCVSTTTVTVYTLDTTLPNVKISGPTEVICTEQNALLTASGGNTYLWDNGQTTPSISVTATGSYSVMATNELGCSKRAIITVTVNPLPSVSLVNLSNTYCKNADVVTLMGAPAGGVFTVDDSKVTMLNPSSLSVGEHTVVYSYTSTVGCTNSISQTVAITDMLQVPVLETLIDQSYPGGVSSLTVSENTGHVILTVSGCLGGTIDWNGGNATTLAVSTSTPGNFTYSATCHSNSCISPLAKASVTVVPTTLGVLHRDADYGNTSDQIIRPYLELSNASNEPIPYGEVTIRYWFTAEGNSPPTDLSVYYAQLGTDKVRMKYVALNRPHQGASGYIEYSFDGSAGYLAAQGNSGPIENGILKTDRSNFNESDDYSYAANYSNYTPNAHITAYRNGTLFWGQEPAQVPVQTLVKVYSAAKDGPTTSQITTRIELRNEGNVPIAVQDLKVRYWFTSDNGQPASVHVDYAEVGAQNIQSQVFLMKIPVDAADSYAELQTVPTSMSLAPMSSLGAIDLRLVRSDYGLLNQTNDYSYLANYGNVGLNPQITVYLNGTLVFGSEPTRGSGRKTVDELVPNLLVRLLGNPVVGSNAVVEIKGVTGQPVVLQLFDLQGRQLHEQHIEQANQVDRVTVPIGTDHDILLLEVSIPGQRRQLKLLHTK